MLNRQSIRYYASQPFTIILMLVALTLFITINSFTTSSDQDVQLKQIQDLRSRIEDLRRIKKSIGTELQQLVRERVKILKEKASLLNRNEKLLNQIDGSKLHLKQLELDISANRRQKFEQSAAANRLGPILFNPLRSIDLIEYSISQQPRQQPQNVSKRIHRGGNGVDSMDLSVCPLSKRFGFSFEVPPRPTSVLISVLKSHRDLAPPSEACFNVSLVGSPDDLSYLKVNSRNDLVINLSGQHNDYILNSSNSAHLMLASTYFSRDSFNDGLDIVIPSIFQSAESYDTLIGSMPPQTPLERKYLAVYLGKGGKSLESGPRPSSNNDGLTILEQTLQTIHRGSMMDSFMFNYNCNPRADNQCYEQRESYIGKSMFLILLPSKSHVMDVDTNDLIYYSLLRQTIPVIVSKPEFKLPFGEVIDWRRAAIFVPKARLSELHFILRSYSPSDLYQLKYHGRRIFENYFASSKQVLDTLINIIRIEKFVHPPPPITDVNTLTYYPSTQLKFDADCSSVICQESKNESIMSLLSQDFLGPREYPFASPSFRRNYSLILNSAYDLWNNPMYSPNFMFPSLPTDPVPPSEFKFVAQDQGFRPIAGGQGGSGYEFSQSIGGDYHNEQFTVVLLTHERKTLLMRTLERLKGMAFMNKIIVVWNGVSQKPSPDLIWPEVGVPLELVRVDQNSLNNRFLPFDAIETDAIFSMDDDSPLRPDEIVFAFRVWRQSRDRIVGFPGRFHAWDSDQNAWVYNSNHSCELSMVLTGGAFFHKYYSYMYSYFMPESIRSIVDKFMNCEDIAMNFLVAHITRKPPIKVTSRWTFHCANCLTSLSEDDSHFQERHECLNMFSSIYGYMPLLNTQHRSDSILFKTRLPRDKQKCFKFV